MGWGCVGARRFQVPCCCDRRTFVSFVPFIAKASPETPSSCTKLARCDTDCVAVSAYITPFRDYWGGIGFEKKRYRNSVVVYFPGPVHSGTSSRIRHRHGLNNTRTGMATCSPPATIMIRAFGQLVWLALSGQLQVASHYYTHTISSYHMHCYTLYCML